MIIRFDGFGIETTPTEAVEFVKLFDVQEQPKAETSEQKTRRTPANKKDIDVGKIHALKNAGWSVEKIADEMKLGTSTVYKKLQIGA